MIRSIGRAVGWSCVLAVYLLVSESLHLVRSNAAFLTDLGLGWLQVAGAYLVIALAAGSVVGALTDRTHKQILALAGVYYLIVSLNMFWLGARILRGPGMMLLFLGASAAGAWAVYRATRRWNLAPSTPILVVAVYFNVCRLIAGDWLLRGGSLLPFLTATETVVKALAGAAAIAVGLVALGRWRERAPVVHGVAIALLVAATVAATAAPSMTAGDAEISPSEAPGGPLPDVYVLSFDALRQDSLREYVAAHPTGALADLLARGTEMENVVSDGVATYAILGNNTFGPADARRCEGSVPGRFRARGYSTAMFLGRYGKRFDGAQCYDRYYSGSGAALAQQYAPLALASALSPGGQEELRADFMPSEALLAEIEDELDAAGARPVFVYAHFLDLHGPYLPSALARDDDYRAALRRYMSTCYKEACPAEENRALIDQVRAGYHQGIEDVDRIAARIAALQAARGRPAVTVLTADHGELFGEHGGFAHSGGFVPELLDIPFVIHGSDRRVSVQRRCELMTSSEALSAVAGSVLAGSRTLELPDRERLVLEAPPLGRAEISAADQTLRYEIAPRLRPHRGTWRNLHADDQGEVPYPLPRCPTVGAP